MIKIRNLHKYYGEHHLFKGLDLTIQKNEVVVLIGPSGGGKSSLLRCMNGLEFFQQGEIDVDDVELHSINHQCPSKADFEALQKVRRKVGMVFQQFNLFPHMSVLGNIIEAPIHVLEIARDEAVENAMSLLKRINMAHKAKNYPEELSGGEQQRVAIARALAMKPEAILFDEPTSSLDPEMAEEVIAVIKDVVHKGMTIVLSTHQMHFARDVADRVVVLDHGDIIESGTAEQVFAAPRSERTKTFLKRIITAS